MKRPIKKQQSNDPVEIVAKTHADKYPGPAEYHTIPDIVGAGEFDENAKWTQRAQDRNKHIQSKLSGHRIHNEMQDEADDNTNFLGYCSDN